MRGTRNAISINNGKQIPSSRHPLIKQGCNALMQGADGADLNNATHPILEEEDEGLESKASPCREQQVPSLLTTFRKKGRSFMDSKKETNVSQDFANNADHASKYVNKLQRIISQAVCLRESRCNIMNSPSTKLLNSVAGCENLPPKGDPFKRTITDFRGQLPRPIDYAKRCINRSISNTKGAPLESTCYDNKVKGTLLTERCQNTNNVIGASKLSKALCINPKANPAGILKRRYFRESNKENSKLAMPINNGAITCVAQKENSNYIQLPYVDSKGLPRKASRGELTVIDFEKKTERHRVVKIKSRHKFGTENKKKPGKAAKGDKNSNKTQLEQTEDRIAEELQDDNNEDSIDGLYIQFGVKKEEKMTLVPKLESNMQWLMTQQLAAGQTGMFQLFEPELEIFASLLQ